MMHVDAMWAFEFLGLQQDASAQSIKRAYAQSLKKCRPDENPEGFQQLHQAYQAALDWQRQHADRDSHIFTAQQPVPSHELSQFPTETLVPAENVETPSPSFSATSEAPQPSMRVQYGNTFPFASPSPRVASAQNENVETVKPLDVRAFLIDCAEQAGRMTSQGMEAWLAEHPHLWSLQNKQRVSVALVPFLVQRKPPIEDDTYDVLLEFFDLNNALSDVDALLLKQLGALLHHEWLVHADSNIDAKVQSLTRDMLTCGGGTRLVGEGVRQAAWMPGLGGSLFFLRSNLSQIFSPFHWGSVLLACLIPPWRPRQLRNLLVLMGCGPEQTCPPSLDARQVNFWLKAGDCTYVSWPWLVALTTGLACMSLMGLALFTGFNFFVGGTSGEESLRGAAWLVSRLCVGAVLCLALWRLFLWQTAPDLIVRFRIGSWLLIPLLCATSTLALGLWDAFVVAIVCNALALGLAVFRHSVRHQWLHGAAPAFLHVKGYVSLMLLAFPYAGSALALFFWLMDLRNHFPDWPIWFKRAKHV